MPATIYKSEQVSRFAVRLHPDHRRMIKAALKELSAGRGDVLALEDRLAGYYRLRIGRFRLIFRYRSASVIDALFLEARRVVYEIFASEFAECLARPDSGGKRG